MNHLLERQIRRCAIMVSLFVSVVLQMGSGALAKYRPSKPAALKEPGTNPVVLAKYQPPPKPSTPKGTGTNTTRGGSCDRNSTIGLTTLVPVSHVGQTSSGHPTFSWFVPDRQPYSLQFRLFKPNGQLLYRTEMRSQSGIMQFSLPHDQPELMIGQIYRWQVVLVCNPNAPFANVIVAADIEVVEPIATLQTQLAAAQTPQQQLSLYAESGLWYDALAEALKVSHNSQNSVAVVELLDSLASLEADAFKDWSDRLNQIGATLVASAEPHER